MRRQLFRIAILLGCAALTQSTAFAQPQGQPTPEWAEVTVSLATLPEPFEMEVLEDLPAEPELGAGELVIKYWGDGEAIGLLQDIAWSVDINDPAHTSLPLGIAPLSDQTVPTMSLDAIAVLVTSNGATVLLADENGLIGIRTAGQVSSIIPQQVEEFQLAVAGVLEFTCNAESGACHCTASGSGAQCKAWSDGAGTHEVECSDAYGTMTCEGTSNTCGCTYEPADLV